MIIKSKVLVAMTTNYSISSSTAWSSDRKNVCFKAVA